MDGHGFDLLTKRLAVLTTRRRGFRFLLAGAGLAGALGLDPENVGAACGGPGTRCQNGGSCCSKICLRRRKKKGKKSRTKGKCDCSFPQEGCNVSGDCCFETSTCGDNGCDPDRRCCEGEGAECLDPCDCCFNFICSEDTGRCVPCGLIQDPCGANDPCCADGSACADNGNGQGKVCCLVRGFDCVDDFDCCGAQGCSGRAGNTCQTCASLGGPCGRFDDNCCHPEAECFDNACGAGNVCCLPGGASCEDDCDCCEDHLCHPGTKTCRFDLS